MIERTDNGIQVDVAGLVGAYERRWRRWRGAFQWSLVVGALALCAGVGILALRADMEHRRANRMLAFDLAEARARAGCWQVVALHPPGYGPTVPLAQREAAVAQCIERELQRWVATKNGGRR